MDWDLPRPIIYIYTDQSEWLYNNQSELKSLATQDSVIWTNQKAHFGSSFA